MRDNFNEDALPVEPDMHRSLLSVAAEPGRFAPKLAPKQHYNPADFSSLATAINDLSNICRQRADSWYYDLKTGERLVMNDGERMMLMVSEIAEAFEGKRKDLMDSHLTHRKAVDVELADLLIRVLDYAGENCQDLGGALIEKLEYNRNRADHKKEARLGANGKK